MKIWKRPTLPHDFKPRQSRPLLLWNAQISCVPQLFRPRSLNELQQKPSYEIQNIHSGELVIAVNRLIKRTELVTKE